ncbi:MAG TPA: methionyl-tRNA formyltransferase [Thermoanaerobaculia bacterium]
MRIAFFGTPQFAVPALDALAREHEVVLVVAQADKPAGRGMEVKAPAVAVRARELGVPLIQPAKVREAIEDVRRASPDIAIVVAYGKILPAALLEIPRRGFLNIHGSILPRWRGAAPIQRAIEHGDPETGVTIMRVDEELDHGPMLAIAKTPIGADEHAPSLAARLSTIGAEALLDVLARLDSIEETAQDHALATFAPKIEKSEGEIDWNASAKSIYDKFRAFDPWPGVFTKEGLKLIDIQPATGHQPPATIVAIDDGVTIACGDGAIRIITMQRPGKPRAAAGDVARGLRWRVGTRLS